VLYNCFDFDWGLPTGLVKARLGGRKQVLPLLINIMGESRQELLAWLNDVCATSQIQLI